MSYSYKEGKDEVHFITEDDLNKLAITNEEEDQQTKNDRNADVHEQYPGAVSPDGEINWDCPCLGGLGTEGPCVTEFRSAFSCWLYSESEEKGEDCVDNFFAMSNCMRENAEFYDELNERNKAAAEEARQRYEAEEKEKLKEAAIEQQSLESIEGESPSAGITGPGCEPELDQTKAELLDSSHHHRGNGVSMPNASTQVMVAASTDENESESEVISEVKDEK